MVVVKNALIYKPFKTKKNWEWWYCSDFARCLLKDFVWIGEGDILGIPHFFYFFEIQALMT